MRVHQTLSGGFTRATFEVRGFLRSRYAHVVLWRPVGEEILRSQGTEEGLVAPCSCQPSDMTACSECPGMAVRKCNTM